MGCVSQFGVADSLIYLMNTYCGIKHFLHFPQNMIFKNPFGVYIKTCIYFLHRSKHNCTSMATSFSIYKFRLYEN